MLLRSIERNDLPACIALLKRIWDFSGFSHPMGEEATAAWYLHHHLQPSTHAFVLELNGLVVGYLLGTIPGDRTFDSKPEWKCIGHQVEDTWQAVTTAEERQTFLNEWFYGGTWAEEVLKRKAISKDASVWIQLFIVDPEVQGQGLGSRLWKAFEEVRIKRASEQWVLLHTDTWCGFQFYERRGLVRLATCPVKELPIDANGVQPAYFLYGLRPTCLRVS